MMPSDRIILRCETGPAGSKEPAGPLDAAMGVYGKNGWTAQD